MGVGKLYSNMRMKKLVFYGSNYSWKLTAVNFGLSLLPQKGYRTQNMKPHLMSITVILVFLISLASAQAYLENNFYFTMAPNSTECLYTTLPSDLGFLDQDNYTLKIRSDFETNLNFIQAEATKDNAVRIPICFSAKNKKEGEYSSYNITISGTKFSSFEFKGGICVSKVRDADKATTKLEKNPCEIINGLDDLLWLDLYPQQILSTPGQEETIYMEIWPSVEMDVDLSINTNAQININSSYLRLKQYERKQLELKIKTPSKGEYYINVTAKAVFNRKYCDLPFCKKEAETKISVDGVKKADGWSFLVLPRFLSAYNTKPIEYVTVIENNLEDRSFSIQVDLPPGLKADTTNITDFIRKGERKEYKFNVTILENIPQKFTIDFVVKGDVERELTAFLSLYESADDIRRQWNTIRNSVDDRTKAEIDDLVNRYLIDLKDGGFNLEEYDRLQNKIKEAQGSKTNQSPSPTASQSPTGGAVDQSQLLFIILIPIAVIVILFVLLLSKKRKIK